MKTPKYSRSTFALAFTLLGAVALTTGMQRGAIPSRPQGPCDIYGAAGTPCAAAHSTTRALSASYNGPLYQVTRQSDGRTLDIGVVAPVASPVPDPGGYADAAAQAAFCTGTLCVISEIFDQSGKGNHLYQAPPGPLFPGPAKGGFDTQPIADMAPMTIGGHKAYGVYVMPGMGFRNNDATGLAIGDEPEGIYYVVDGTHYDSGCCFDYGNASTNGRAVGTGTMETTYFGTSTAWGRGSGPGPWIMADMEAGLFSGYDAKQNAATPTIDAWRFVTAVVDGGGGNKWDLRGGDAQHGGLTTLYSGVRPGTPASDAYYPMHKQGAILLGVGGDNGNGSSGTFYEGVMTTGYPSTATTDAVQANIVAARYDVLPVSLSRVTTFTPGSSQPLTATFTNSTGAVVPGATVRLTVPAGWRAVASGSAGTAVTFREPIASGASVSATFTVTAPAATGAGVMTATAQWTNGRGKASETTTARVRNVLPITINEVRLGPGANPTDQFVELYNASAGAVDLSGWRLVNTPSQWASVTLATIPAGTTLAPRAFYLLGLSSSGLAAPADRGATAIHVRSTTGLAAGQTIDIDGESRTAVSVGTAATAMTTVFVPVSTGPWITIPPGSTNLPVTSATGFAVGQPIGIDIGGAYEQATVTAVGKAATQTTLSTAAMAGATSIAVAASENISAGDTLTIGTGGRKERATVASAGTGIALAAPLTRDHASGVDVSDVGTGISFSPATRFPHRSGDAVQALGGGITLDRALANGHGYGAPVRDPRAATDGYQGPAPSQWFGGVLSARAGSIALLDVSGAVIVDAIVYGSQQSNSSGNGTIASPHLATLEADQGKGGCIAVVPAAGRGGPGAVTAAALDRSLGRFPDGLDADELCTDFLLQPATTMLAASTAGAATIKVASVAGFTAGQTLTIDSGANVETAVVATVGTPGATTVGAATEVGATVVPVASAVGFSAGQTITIDTGANEETAVVAAPAGGRGGARITVVAPLTRAHAAGAQVSGSGITLTAALTRPHTPGTAVATDPPTPGAPNRYSNRPIPASPSAAKAGQAQPSRDRWWTGYGNGPDNSRYFEARQIDKTNVGQLQVAWTYPFGDTGSNPIVVRGVAYGRGRNGSLVAVNAQTGQELWVRERMNGMTSRGINYWESPDGRDRRLIFSMDSLLQEVDARTGTSIQSFGTNGVVDLRVGIDGRDPDTIGPIQSNTPGEIFENLLILGSATGEGYMSPPGDIRAYDVLTGKLVWTFHTVPRPGEYGYDTWPKDAWKYVGGTNSWGEMTVDTARGIAYVPIGSPTYDFYGADRAGANLFGTSIVALDARTGRRRWHFQLVHHDLWDMDPSAAPQLTTIRQGGRTRDVVAVTAKTGWLYVFDRVTGEPIWPIEERPVPKSTMEGEQSWPTQPVPTKPAAYIKHTFTVDDINPDLPTEQAAGLRTRLLAADNNGIFAPISTRDTVSVPASNGGTLFGGAAAEPRTGAVYVVAHDNPGIVRLLRPGEGRGFGGPPVSPGQIVYEQNCQVCHGVNRQGTDTGAPLVYAAADPANGIAAGAPRFAGAAIRAVLATGKNRMPPFPHLSAADVDNLVSLLTTAAGGRGRGAFPGRSSAAGSGAPPDLIAGSGSAWVRPDSPGGRGRAPVPYPEGTPDYTRYTINEYHTVANGIRPPFTTIVKFDLNAPAVKWRIPFGDDPALAARGITGTGAPATNNGIILTASGLVFGAGLDNHIRAWDSDTGTPLWSSRFGGNFTGSPVMYVMGGKQYLLVAAASTPARRGGADPAALVAPTGWVAYALPR